MDLADLSRRDADRLPPTPADELARLRRLLAVHRRLSPPFDGAMRPGSFHAPAARILFATGRDMKTPFTFAF